MAQIPPLLCSTGAFSRHPDYTFYRDILEYGPLLDVDGFEVMFYRNWYPEIEHIATDLQRSGLSFPAVHAEKSIGVGLGQPNRSAREQALHNLQLNCQLAQQIGARLLILHLWGWPELDDHLAYNLDLLPQCLDAAANHNLEIAIETIPCRVSTPLHNVHLAALHDARSHVTLDTEFLALHDQITQVFNTPWLWLDQRIRHIHIKDFSGNGLSLNGRRRYLHPGEGVIDFPSFFSHLQQQQYQGNISLESPVLDDKGQPDIPKLQKSLSSLRSLLTQAYSL